MTIDPISLMAMLQNLQQGQGGGQSPPPGGMIPPGQVSPQPPMQAPGIGQQPQSPATMPPMGGQDQTVNPLMQMAQRAMSNPQAQTIPQPPAAPSTSSAHPILAKIMQALSSGMQNFGFGMQTGPQQLERLQLNQQKSEAMANLAATQAWREAQTGIAQQRVGIAEQGQQTAERKAATAEENVKSEVAHRQAMEGIYQGRLDLQKTIGEARVKYMQGKLAQGAQALVQNAQKLKQNYELTEQKLGVEQARTGIMQQANEIKQQYVELQGLSISQRGTEEGTKAALELSKLQADHWFQDMLGLGGIGTATTAVGQATPMPGATAPNFGGGSVSGVSAPAMPPTGAPAKPTPQAKAQAKGGGIPKKAAQSNDPLGIR